MPKRWQMPNASSAVSPCHPISPHPRDVLRVCGCVGVCMCVCVCPANAHNALLMLISIYVSVPQALLVFLFLFLSATRPCSTVSSPVPGPATILYSFIVFWPIPGNNKWR